MKKKYTLAIVLIFILSFSMQVYAKDVSSYSVGSLCDCDLFVGISSDGIIVSYTTGATVRASEIGCKNIVLQEKVNGSWKDISIPNGKTTNSSSYGGSSTYKGAVKGRSYRAHCTHYADFNGTVKTLYNETNSIVFN